jgi:competence protein ComEC
MRRKNFLLYFLSILLFFLSIVVFFISIRLTIAAASSPSSTITQISSIQPLLLTITVPASETPQNTSTSSKPNPTKIPTITQFTESTTPTINTATNSELPTPTLISSANLSSNLQVHFIDVDQGDSILIKSPDGKMILIDGGDSNFQALNYLKNAGVKKIDLMIATHPHADHIGGLVEILNSIPTTRVITNGELYTTQVYEQFLDAIANANAEYSEVKQGDTISIGDLNFSVLNPLNLSQDNTNNNSIVLKLTYGNVSFLFMGDAEEEVESRIMWLDTPLKSDIIKLGHHGSYSSSTVQFIVTVLPAIAIYSAGLENSYNHPDPTVIERLLRLGITVYGTDKNGTITVSTDGENYAIDTTLSNSPVSLP